MLRPDKRCCRHESGNVLFSHAKCTLHVFGDSQSSVGHARDLFKELGPLVLEGVQTIAKIVSRSFDSFPIISFV